MENGIPHESHMAHSFHNPNKTCLNKQTYFE